MNTTGSDMKNRIAAAIAAILVSTTATAQQAIPMKQIPDNLPACVHPEKSELHFPGSRDAQDAFLNRLDSLLAGEISNVNIWHIGGSHVQGGHFSYRIMENLAAMAPGMKGERGIIFPMRLAKTNSDKSFRTSATGEWVAPMMTRNSKVEKPRYGITGFGARTSDDGATVSLGLNVNADSVWTFNRLRVLGYGSSADAYPYLIFKGDTIRFEADPITDSYVFDLHETTDSIDVHFNVPEGETFTLNGLQPISGRTGINYFASGVNGAKVTSWLAAEDLQRDLQLVHPDLAIFGLGINDSACKASEFKPERFKANYGRLIEMIRKESPDCAFIFLTNNDSYRYVKGGMTFNENARAVQKAMYELAEEYGAGVWDILEIMGGTHTVLDWRDNGLIKEDKLHFTREGYVLLADLFYNALARDHNDGINR